MLHAYYKQNIHQYRYKEITDQNMVLLLETTSCDLVGDRTGSLKVRCLVQVGEKS